MKLKHLMKKIKSYLDADAEQLQQDDEGLAKVLKKLKQKEKLLRETITVERNEDERELMEQELIIVHSQRKKGIGLLSQLRK